MKKKSLITVGLLVSVLAGPVASANPVIRFGAPSQRVTVPAIEEVRLSPLAQCEFQSGQLQNQLDAQEQRIRELQDQVLRLTPGTCQNQCASRPNCEENGCSGLDALYSYGACVQSCHLKSLTSGFMEDDDRTAAAVTRW